MKVKITVGLVLAAIVIAAVLIFFPRKTAPEVRFTAISAENQALSEPDWAEIHQIAERALAS